MHIGLKIKEVLEESGMSVPEFADSLPCTREHAYKIFKKEHLDTDLLLSICRILHHDFFNDISQSI